MALINDRDVLLTATYPRVLGSEGTVFLLLTSDFQQFDVNAAGVATPTSITFVAHPFQLPQDITTWSVSTGAILTGSGNTRSLAFSSLTTKSATVTATIVSNGVTYAKSLVVSQYHEGIIGIRAKMHVYATGSAWSDATANAAVTAPTMQGDSVTIGNGTSFILTKVYDGTAWNPDTTVIDGSLTVTNSITAASINTSGLTIKDNSGVTIFSATTPLAGTYIANAAITTAKIGDAQITGAKIVDATITNAKIGTAEVGTLTIAGNAVTIPVSANAVAGSQRVDADGEAWAYAVSASITSIGQPIFITWSLSEDSTLSGGTTATFSGTYLFKGETNLGLFPNTGCLQDTPGAGTFTYSIRIRSGGGYTPYYINYAKSTIMLLETKR